jgi:hypothetical protein
MKHCRLLGMMSSLLVVSIALLGKPLSAQNPQSPDIRASLPLASELPSLTVLKVPLLYHYLPEKAGGISLTQASFYALCGSAQRWSYSHG